MSSIVAKRLTPEEYLEREREGEIRHEYRDGEIVAMAGASLNHGRIVRNFMIRMQLGLGDRPCEVFSTDLQLAVRAANLITYPDLMVICGEPALAYDRGDVVLNPVIIIEVLSKSTEKYDRGPKFASYQQIPSLMEYLTVAQDKIHIERWLRQPDGQWTRTEFTHPATTITLESIAVELHVADIYEKVDLTI